MRVSVREAYACRDCLAKALYQRVVEEAVSGINSKFGGEVSCDTTVSLLDLPAFDFTSQNTFDQLLIK